MLRSVFCQVCGPVGHSDHVFLCLLRFLFLLPRGPRGQLFHEPAAHRAQSRSLAWFVGGLGRVFVRARISAALRLSPAAEAAPALPGRQRALEASRGEYRDRFYRVEGLQVAEPALGDLSAELSEALQVAEAADLRASSAVRDLLVFCWRGCTLAEAGVVVREYSKFLRVFSALATLLVFVALVVLGVCLDSANLETVRAELHVGERRGAVFERFQDLASGPPRAF